jgi:hypothetical protein
MSTWAAWKVAGAILTIENRPIHYDELAHMVMETGLTKLGKSGISSVDTTMHGAMTAHPWYFRKVSPGWFEVTESAGSNITVAHIVKLLTERGWEPSRRSEVEQTVQSDLDSIRDEEGQARPEGKKRRRYTNHFERNPKLRAQAILIHRTTCMVPGCNFSFEATYGERGTGFIEVHHVKPLSDVEGETSVDPRTDLVVVCSNCHRMIHRKKNQILTLEEVGELMKRATSD